MPKERTRSKPTGLPIIHPYAAGIDIGSRFHAAAVSPDLCDEPVQTFRAFTADLERMAEWLIATGTKTVVMESTGVYCVAAFEVLKSHGLEVILANAREARAVPGRKSDVNDAQWLQRLHACGLLRTSFRPGRDIVELRAYLRVREKHTAYAAAHIQHMQKALTYMNIQLHHVIATINGVTGMRIIRVIVAGDRDPDKLAAMRDLRCKESIETIRGALVGNYQPEHLFALRQSLALYDFYQQCIDECDAEIEKAVAGLNSGRPIPGTSTSEGKASQQNSQRSKLQCAPSHVSTRRHRPDTNPRRRSVPGTAPDRRMRDRSEWLADRQNSSLPG
jgi:transposase